MVNRLKKSLVIGGLMLAASVGLSLGQSQSTWIGDGTDPSMSNPANWDGGVVPSGVTEGLLINGSAPITNVLDNDLTGATFQNILLSNTSTELTGSAFNDVSLLGYATASSASTRLSAPIGAAVTGLSLFLGVAGQNFNFTNTLTLAAGGANVLGADAATDLIDLSESGTITAAAPTSILLEGATLRINNFSSNVAGRIDDNVTVELAHFGQLKFVGTSGVDSTQTVAHVTNLSNGVISVERNFDDANTAQLSVTNLAVPGTGTTLFQSTGDTQNELGVDGLNIFIGGQANSTFLGPQSYYLNGSIGGPATYQFAAYDTTAGVIAATTDTDNLAIAPAGANVLVTSGSVSLSSDTAEINSLAFNGDVILGAGALKVTHLLMTQDGAEIATTVDFGNNDGTITAENWDQDYIHVGFTGEIAGTKSLTFRGYGDVSVESAASFSGTLNILGDRVFLENGGAFGPVSDVQIGAADGVPSTLVLKGSDNGVNIDRLGNSAPITAEGLGGIELWSDDDSGGTGIAVSENIGPVTVNTGAAFSLSAVNGDSSNPAKPATLTVASVAFASSSSTPSGLLLEAVGDNNSVVVGGTMILVGGSNELHLHIQGNGARIETPGVRILAGNPDAIVEIATSASTTGFSTIAGDFDLADGKLFFESLDGPVDPMAAGHLSLEGNLTMGASLDTYLLLGVADGGVTPYINLDGYLTLDGTLLVSQSGTFTEGDEWLLFEVTGGGIDDYGWNIQGQDGAYSYLVDGNKVYLIAVPEPGTTALFVVAAGLLFVVARRRRRLAA